MRIVEDSPSQLKLRDRTLWISAVALAAAVFDATGVVVTRHPSPIGFAPAALFVLFGLGFLQATDVTFDLAAKVCRIRRLRLIRASTQEIPFADIQDVRVDSRLSKDVGATILSRLSLVTSTGAVPLTGSYEQGPERYDAMRTTVIGVVFAGRAQPADATKLDPVVELLRAGRRLDAIELVRAQEGASLTDAERRITGLTKTLAD